MSDVKNMDKQLFNDYIFYRDRTAHVIKLRAQRPYLRQLKMSKKRLLLFRDLYLWCMDKGVEPRQWLYSLFVVRRFLYDPRLERSHLCSERHLLKFPTVTNYELMTKRRREEQQLKVLSGEVLEFDPNRDVSQATEYNKRKYLNMGGPEYCMSQMSDKTFGYHPESLLCARCSAKAVCRDCLSRSVNFDIQALREGRITSAHARNSAMTCRVSDNDYRA